MTYDMLPGRPISGGSVLNGQVHDAEEALALHFRMKIQFLGSHTITLPVIQASSTQKPGPFNTLPPLIDLPGSMFGIHVPLVTQLGTTSVAWYNLHFGLMI
jgi:hypothetical protein